MSFQNNIRFLSEDYSDVIQLMIEYVKCKKLDSSFDNGTEQLIQECKDCRILFEDIKIFLDEEDTMVYELLNEQVVNELTLTVDSESSKNNDLKPIYTTFLKTNNNEWLTELSECMCDTEY